MASSSNLTGANFSVLDSVVVKANGGSSAADASSTDQAENFLSTTSQGSGPFTMTSYERNQKIVLTRVDNYWGGTPAAIQQFIVQNIPDPSVQAAALERGDIDLTWNLIGNSDLVQRLQGENLQIDQQPTLEYYDILFNANPQIGGPVQQRRCKASAQVRHRPRGSQADLPHRHAAHGGIAQPAVGGFAEDDPNAINENLDMARQLLTEAGYANGFNVTLSGFKIGGACPSHEDIATKLAQDWARIGIQSTLTSASSIRPSARCGPGSTRSRSRAGSPTTPTRSTTRSTRCRSPRSPSEPSSTRATRTPLTRRSSRASSRLYDMSNEMLHETDPVKRQQDFLAVEAAARRRQRCTRRRLRRSALQRPISLASTTTSSSSTT